MGNNPDNGGDIETEANPRLQSKKVRMMQNVLTAHPPEIAVVLAHHVLTVHPGLTRVVTSASASHRHN